MSDQTGGSSVDSALPAGNRRKPKKFVNREIVSLDTVPQDTIPQDAVPLGTPPSELADFFDPPLVGNEKREDFDRFCMAITLAVKPSDAIAWLYTWDVVCLSWEIRRERAVKAGIIKSLQIDFLSGLLKLGNLVSLTGTGASKIPGRPNGNFEARQWVNNPKSLPEISKLLADSGYGPSDILAKAYILAQTTSMPLTGE